RVLFCGVGAMRAAGRRSSPSARAGIGGGGWPERREGLSCATRGGGAGSMRVGGQVFSGVRPQEKSGEQYFQEALDLAEEADRLGFSHIRIVEHYFHYYGGYSPNPIVFLAAAAQRTNRARLVTGAVLPAFNHPLKLAGEIAMLDTLSRGRL